MDTFYKIAAHTLEIIVILFVAYAVTHWFNLGGEDMADIMTIILAALAKTLRESSWSPIPDWVNKTD